MKDTIFVTGSTGYIGRTLVPLLARHHRVRPYKGDIRCEADIRTALKGCSAVIHLAVVKDGQETFSVNVGGASALVAACKKTGVTRIVNVSTQSTKILKKGSYALSKYQSDRIFASSGLDVTTLLVSVLYSGDPDSLFGQIVHLMERFPVIPVIGPGMWKSKPVFLPDLCAIIEACLCTPRTIGKTYDVGGPDEIDFNSLIQLIARFKGIQKRIVHVPVPAGLWAARVLAWVVRPPPVTVNNILGSTQNTPMHTGMLYRDIPVRPVSLRAGLVRTFDGKESVRVGVVGLGKMGLMHAALLTTMKDVSLVAISDRENTLCATARSLGLTARFYSSPQKMIESELLDAVYVCTPTFTHYEITKHAIEQGLHVFVEKPLTENVRKTEQLVRLARMRGVVGAVGYHLMYSRLHRTLKKILDDGILGSHIRIRITLRHSEVLGPTRGWLFTKQLSGGGVVINPASHIVSWLTHIFGFPDRVTGSMHSVYSKDVEDEAIIKLRFRRAQATIDASWSEQGYQNLFMEIRCTGDKGSAVLRGDRIERTNGRTIFEQDLPAEYTVDLNPGAYGEAYFYESRAFIDTISGRPKPLVTFTDAARTERVIYEFYITHR